MTSIITLPNDHFAVQVESDAKSFVINDTNLLIYEHSFDRIGLGTDEFKQLPPGSYTIVGLASGISNDDKHMIVESMDLFYRDYSIGGKFDVLTVSRSFDSLLACLSLEASTTVILKQNK